MCFYDRWARLTESVERDSWVRTHPPVAKLPAAPGRNEGNWWPILPDESDIKQRQVDVANAAWRALPINNAPLEAGQKRSSREYG